MRLTPDFFGALTDTLLRRVGCPVVAALEGGYNSPVTCRCCEAVLRSLLDGAGGAADGAAGGAAGGTGGVAPAPPAASAVALPAEQRVPLHKCVEPTLREVLRIQSAHWPSVRVPEGQLAAYFLEASKAVALGARPEGRWPGGAGGVAGWWHGRHDAAKAKVELKSQSAECAASGEGGTA